MFSEISEKKQLLDQKRPLPVHTLRSIREHLIVNWTYHSNAIVGNSLTLSETKVVLEGITIGGKTIKEHLEVINHKEAILYRLILKNIYDEHAGIYRKENVIISGATHIPPDFVRVPEVMEQLIRSYEAWQTDAHAVERAALLHIDFLKIHPFIDGNGRTARLLLNFELMECGYPPIVIEKEDRAEYYAALDLAHTTGDTLPFNTLISKTLVKTFDWYLKLI